MSKIIKKYGLIVIVIAILTAAVFGIVKFTSIETKTISPMKFSVGGLSTSEGTYIDNEQSIYTKDLIECRGLTVTPDFDGNVSYQIFWYNTDELYFGCTDIYGNRDKFRELDVPDAARYCRIVVYPSQLDKEGEKIDDFKVRFYEPIKYADDITIKVLKKQNFKATDLYKIAKAGTAPEGTLPNLNDKYMFYENMHVFGVTNGVVLYDFDKADKKEIQEYNVIKLDCSNVKDYSIVFKEDTSLKYYFWFYDSKGTALYLDDGSYARCYGKADAELRLSVPENSRYLFINLPLSDNGESLPVIINEYLPRNEVTETLYSNN